jgi:hypothetical protein
MMAGLCAIIRPVSSPTERGSMRLQFYLLGELRIIADEQVLPVLS